jgi:enediyne biosynthesis thioesterase
MPAYEYRHVVGFEETSLVGNVYFTNYLLWQGHCRELFLKDHCPEVLGLLERREIAFFTKSCSCEWHGEWGFSGLEEVLVRMRLSSFRGGRMGLEFRYSRTSEPKDLLAIGAQEVHCKAQHHGVWTPSNFPPPLVQALLGFADTPDLRGALGDSLEFADGMA